MKKHTPNESFARNTDGYRGIKPSKPSATLIRLDGNPCSEGGNNEKLYSAELATTIYAFYVSRGWSVR